MVSVKDFWIEAYRPRKLEDLCIPDDTREIIKGFGDTIPNLLLVGKPGQGKTTLAQILVLDILKCDYLYINASDENGIDTVRDKISGFSQTKSFDGNKKVIILDECDNFTNAGQDALRNTMEQYAASTRFILTGNYIHKLSKALQSRCQRLDIRPPLKEAFQRCLNILKLENIKVSTEQKKLLAGMVKSTYPDLRQCINEMQKHCRDGELKLGERTNNNTICEYIMSNIASKKVLEVRKYLIENDGIFNCEWDRLLVDLLNYIYNMTLTDSKKKAMILTIADHLEKSSRVVDQEINFFACILNLEEI